MICPKCHEVDDGSVYCVSCGTRLVNKDSKVKPENPIERHSSRFKSSKPKEEPKSTVNTQYRQVTSADNKLDILILQNKELIKQNNRIIELLEKLTR